MKDIYKYYTEDTDCAMKEVKIVEEGIRFENPVIVQGLPDVGLVGTIAISYLVGKLNFKEVGHIESKLFPPIMVVHNGELKNPVRIYSNEKELITILSEVVIPPPAVYPLAEALVEWFEEKDVSLSISLTGFPVANRLDIDAPSIIGVGNSKEAISRLKEAEIDPMLEGFIVGMYPVMLEECKKRGITAISLLAQCFPSYPDPEAAASVIRSLQRLTGLEIDLNELLEKGEEIKLNARDLMRQTNAAIAEMQKNTEQSMPIMYG